MCNFFDIDYIYNREGNEYTFLEVNFNPVPIVFEEEVYNGLNKYSAKILHDWVAQ